MNNWRSVSVIALIAQTTFKGGLRDRLVQGLTILGLFFILTTGIFSSFSMRQTFEVAINYSLSTVNIIAILVTLFLGLNLLSSEITSKVGQPTLTAPIARSSYILGKFGGLFLLIFLTVFILGLSSLLGVYLSTIGMKNLPEFSIFKYATSLAGTLIACTVLGSITVLLTSIASSAILPFLLSCATYAIGESTQAVKRFLESGMTREHFSPLIKALVKIAYYVFPNFALFDYKVYAIYNIKVPLKLFMTSICYGIIYTATCLFIASILFTNRDLP